MTGKGPRGDNLPLVATPALDREAVDQAIARGSELLKQGKLDDAQQAFRAALQLDRDNARVLALLGLTYFRAGQFDRAQPIYEELVERAPTDPSHRLNLGLVYLKLGDADRAIGALEASRALDPSQGRAISYLGLAYARAGRYVEAYRSFLLAGQQDLAHEVEANLTPAERDGIQAQLAGGVESRTSPPKQPPKPPPAGPAQPATAPAAAPSPASTAAAQAQQQLQNAPPQESLPEIHIERYESDASDEARPHASRRSDAAFDATQSNAGEPAPPAAEISAPRMTDSLMFVLPQRDAVPEPAAGQSIISRAVEVATPSSAASGSGSRVALGSTAPIPLSQLATELLVRPDEGDEAFEVTASGALVIRVRDRVLTRLDGIYVTGGDLEYEPAMRRSRGRDTDEKFDFGGTRMHAVSGSGYLIAVPGDKTFTAVSLDDDILYLREDLVFAFEATLRWENGNVPGLRGKLPVVQFRGDGAVAMRTAEPLVRVKLPAQGVLLVAAMRLAGWIGRVIPRAVVPPTDGPMGEVCVECTGEGVVLIDQAVAQVVTADRMRRPSKVELIKAVPPPPPAPSPPIELDVVKKADWLTDDDDDKPAKKRDEI